MRRILWLALLPALSFAADDPVARGAAVYRASCAVPYCHGPEGKPARAPALAGRGLTPRHIMETAAMGIPNTSMPSFNGRLKPEDFEALAAYIISLGPGTALPEKKPAMTIPAEAKPGRALFFDSARTGACGACHEVGGWGTPVSLALQDLTKARFAAVRDIQTPGVMTAVPAGEAPFPALVAEKTPTQVRVYDLSSRLPVLRTFAPADIELKPGSSWRHADAASLYTDAELAEISRYLQWAAKQ